MTFEQKTNIIVLRFFSGFISISRNIASCIQSTKIFRIDLTILIQVSGLVVNRVAVFVLRAIMVWWVIMREGKVINVMFIILI